MNVRYLHLPPIHPLTQMALVERTDCLIGFCHNSSQAPYTDGQPRREAYQWLPYPAVEGRRT
ncbi:hypothetical protein E2C01_087861 [Portunus trituberculatus]|uniref:Uncharacterized protein n=1 Tax=Portunus trituberculatus TaxID=210409 RepID=A0A5B7JDM6_PORTR|nr:hypothetical protein [Portunus trituberculatus]